MWAWLCQHWRVIRCTYQCRSLARLLNLVFWKHTVFLFTSRKKSEKDTTDSFPSLHLILLCVIILPQRVGRSHCWLRLRDISAHLSGPEPPHRGDPGRMLVRSKWWKHLQGQAELLAIPIPSGWFFLLDAMEFVVCGIAAVLKFSRDVISSLMGQKGKSCSYFKDWFPTWFPKLHDLYYKRKRITRVRFDGWTMNSWPVSDSLSKCLAVHERPWAIGSVFQ